MSGLTTETLPYAENLVFNLRAARKKARILPPNHAYVVEAIKALHESLEKLFAALPSVTITILSGELYVEGQLLTNESLEYSSLIVDLERLSLTGFQFSRGIEISELTRFIELSISKLEDIRTQGGWVQLLGKSNLPHVTFRQVAKPGGEERASSKRVDEAALRDCYLSALQLIRMAFVEVQKSHNLSLDRLEDVVGLLVASVTDNSDVFQGLSTFKSRSEYTFYHSVNVAILSLLMGAKLQLDSPLLYKLGVAAILHDIGKMRIPEEILDKPGPLDDKEWEIMRNHPLEGARVLAEQPKVDPLAVIVAAQHHARYDMKGYPGFEPLGELHFMSNLVAIADVYDALTSDRCYRKALLPERAMQLVIEGRGSHLHPPLVKLFVQLSGLYPVGSLVELNTGELAVVVQANPHNLIHPCVRLIRNGHREIKVDECPLIDLADNGPSARSRCIVRVIDPADREIDITQFF